MNNAQKQSASYQAAKLRDENVKKIKELRDGIKDFNSWLESKWSK